MFDSWCRQSSHIFVSLFDLKVLLFFWMVMVEKFSQGVEVTASRPGNKRNASENR
jgi:hypothetical protein